MAFLESLLAAAASKAGVAAAGAVLTVTGVGTAAVTGNLPADVQTQVDELIGAERGGDDASSDPAELVESAEVAENEAEDENLGTDADAEGGNEVSEAATTAGEGLEGRERGEAVSTAVREANGSADQGQAEERRAEAATRAEAGRANAANADNADAADEAADPETDPAERQADAADKAAAGQANADAAEGDDEVEGDETDADDARQDAQHRPEGAGAPGTEG